MKDIDVVTVGELLTDELRTEAGAVSSVGGAPANFVRGAARRGLRCAFIGAVGDDERGRACIEAVEKDGVLALCAVKRADTTLALVTLDGSGERSFRFVRGADALLSPADVDEQVIARSRVLHMGTLSLSAEPARSAALSALAAAKKNGVPVSCDINYRDALWTSPRQAREAALSVLPDVTLLKASGEEAELLTGESSPFAAAEKLAGLGPTLAAVTLGADGAVIKTGKSTFHVPARRVTAADTTGAGDSFWGAFIACLLAEGWNGGEVCAELARKCAAAGTDAAAECVTHIGAL